MSQDISCATVIMAKTGIYSGTSSNGLSKDPQFNSARVTYSRTLPRYVPPPNVTFGVSRLSVCRL